MAEFGVGDTRDIAGIYELLHHVGLLLPFLGFQDGVRPLLIELLEDVNLLALSVNVYFAASSGFFGLGVGFRGRHHRSLVVGLPEGVKFLLKTLLEIIALEIGL